ncbi:MAG: nicotinate phosphoribosyltransferase [Tannerellaceae bacterium]
MIINSVLDNDLYKFTVSNAYMQLFPHAKGQFAFIDRESRTYTSEMLEEISREIEHMMSLRLTETEYFALREKVRFLPPSYLTYLLGLNFFSTEIQCFLNDDNNLNITATGYLYEITLLEVPILAIVSEVSMRHFSGAVSDEVIVSSTLSKALFTQEQEIALAEFGTRRRFSYKAHDLVVKTFKDNCCSFRGTSNVHLAIKYNVKALGTFPHEWVMFHGAIFGYKQANYLAMENWLKVYDGDLGITLTDTYTSDIFFKNFSRKHAKLFDGVRQDSGDVYVFVDKAVSRYIELDIDPMHKTIIFSDGLTLEKAKCIQDYCKEKIKSSFGIGTHLTNDFGGKPCNIVMKLVNCQITSKQPIYDTVKLSDVEGKHLGDSDEIDLCLRTLRLK